MRRTDRLFEIIQSFKGGQLVLGKQLAARFGVSLRTIYRDIDTLVASGIPIRGERGVGYMLDSPIFLPPLALDKGELAALHLGMEMVARIADDALGHSAERLLAKLGAGLDGAEHLSNLSIYINSSVSAPENLLAVRQAIENRHELEITYLSLEDKTTKRKIRPLHIEFWGKLWTCTAWCLKREGFRVFRIDRISACVKTGVFEPEAGKTYAEYLLTISKTEP